MDETDERHLRRAIALASEARAGGEMPFGSLLVGPTGRRARRRPQHGAERAGHLGAPRAQAGPLAARELDAGAARRTTMYTSCQPCPMCTGAIARSGLGRVVFALAGEQLRSLGATSPDAAGVVYDGPALFDEARIPLAGYHAG